MREKIEDYIKKGEKEINRYNSSENKLLRCELPITLYIVDAKSIKDKFFNFCKGVYLSFKYNPLSPKKQREWWLSRQYYINQSSLDNLEKFAIWQLKNEYKLKKDNEFIRDWAYPVLYLLKNIKENKKTTGYMSTYEFKNPREFNYLGLLACHVMGAGYEFKHLQSKMPMSFLEFKNTQYDCKYMVAGASAMEGEYIVSIRDEIDKWCGGPIKNN